MKRGRLGIWAVAVCAMVGLLLSFAASVAARELVTDAERMWRDLRSSDDVRTKLLAERWYHAVKLQEWSNDTGKFTTNAKYLDHDPDLGWVKLRVIQGTGRERVVKEVTIPLDKLSKTCQARVRQIHALSSKLAEAKVEEEKRKAEEKDGAPANDGNEAREGEMPAEGPLEGRAGNRRDRRGRGEFADESADMNPEDALSQNPNAERSELVATNTGPPLPVALPPLPSRETPSRVPQTPSDPSPAGSATAAGPNKSTEFQHPTTAGELKTTFEAAFNAGDKETLEKLVYWGDSSEQHRIITRQQVIDDAGEARIVAIAIQTEPDAVDQPDYKWTISTTSQFEIEYEKRTSAVQFDWPFGEIDGKYFLGAWSPEDAVPARR